MRRQAARCTSRRRDLITLPFFFSAKERAGSARFLCAHDPDPQGRVSAKWVTVFLATDAKRLRGDHAQAKIAAIAPPANKTQYDPALQIQGSRMKDDRKSEEPTKNSRQDRLKLALRENLKRRKSQARGRSDPAAASSEDVNASLDDAGEGPGR